MIGFAFAMNVVDADVLFHQCLDDDVVIVVKRDVVVVVVIFIIRLQLLLLTGIAKQLTMMFKALKNFVFSATTTTTATILD